VVGHSLPPWARCAAEELAAELKSDCRRGLEMSEALRRLALFGPNEVVAARRVTPLRIFLAQFRDVMVWVLAAAAAVSYLLGETADLAAILAIVILNATLGFVQEYRAERAMERLREMAAPTARVIRAGSGAASSAGAALGELTVPARELVPGDVVIIEAGDRVPADMRVIEAHSLQTQEATLTGESTPVSKSAAPLTVETTGPIDVPNGLFMGTDVAGGRGRGLVVATGPTTEFGRIAGLIGAHRQAQTPLQRQMGSLGRYLVLVCLGVSGLVAWAGILRGEPPLEMLLAGVSLAVAAIPEGLPAVVTVLLALGVQRMIRRQVIVRKLPAVETLGCATIICTDKTGTLTRNEMAVRRIWSPSGVHEVPDQDTGALPPPGLGDPALRLLLVGALLCSNTRLARNDEGGRSHGRLVVQGDPTECALVATATRFGLEKASFEERFPRLEEIPFSAERRRMATIHRHGTDGGIDDLIVFCKGAPDTILGLCTRYQASDGPQRLSDGDRANILAQDTKMAASGLRVLAVAYRIFAAGPGRPDRVDLFGIEEDLILAGLVGLSDPPRREVSEAVRVCRQAGVGVCMITGDHPATALAVAREIELLDARTPAQNQLLTGRDIDALSDRALSRRVERTRVYARVSPSHKLRIVRALRSRGQVVAMTGDGVNDAPAVREADIGVAMGLSGAAVTKEASDMVLTDDNFASIVAALEEGRTIYDNIRRSIRYLLSCNAGEILTMLVGALLRLPLPLLPLQILWVNLVTDGLPAMALGFQAPESDVATRPPRSPREGVFARGLGGRILSRGVIIGLSTIGAYILALRSTGWNLDVARTVAFATLVISQLVHAFDCRSETRSLVEVPLSSNWPLVAGAAISLALFLVAIYAPGLRVFFKTAPLGLREWVWIILASTWGQIALGSPRLWQAIRAGRARRSVRI
jgi:Ca2+-transporting ATPase